MIEETLNAILAELKAHHEWCRAQQVEFEKRQARWEAQTYPGTPEGEFPTSQVQSTEPAPVVEAVARPEPPGKPVEYTKELVGKALMALCEMEGGRDKAAAVLAKFGADRLSAIKAEDYASAIATIEGMKA
jgi:hypothetical protein